jgi:hypothetical protein
LPATGVSPRIKAALDFLSREVVARKEKKLETQL